MGMLPNFEDEGAVNEFIDYLQKGGTLQHVYNMSDADLEVMYLAATRYHRRQEYQAAADSFLFLTFLNPYPTKFWIGLGESLRLNGQHERAADAYRMASHYDPEDPRPYFHAASSLISLERYGEAMDRLLLCVNHAQGKEAYGSMREVAHELIDDITEKLKESRNG